MIGSHIVDQLLAIPGVSVTVLDNLSTGHRDYLPKVSKRFRFVQGSVTDRKLLETLCVKEGAAGLGGVFHLASVLTMDTAKDPYRALNENVIAGHNLVDLCANRRIKIVFSSSASVYGDALVEPMAETHPHYGNTFYGASKSYIEQIMRAYGTNYGLEWVALRYFNVYGTRMWVNGPWAYNAVLIKWIDSLIKGEPMTIFGDGSAAYDFVYVDDVARANILAMMNEEVNGVCLNVGTGVKTSLSVLAQALQTIMGGNISYREQATQPGLVTSRVADIRYIKQTLGWVPTVKIVEGLMKVSLWWLQRSGYPTFAAWYDKGKAVGG